MSQPQLLPYATQDVNATRYPRPFVIWCAAVGAIALATIAFDLLPGQAPGTFYRLRELGGLVRWRGWEAIFSGSWLLGQVVPCLAGPVLAAAVLTTRRSAWTISPASLRLIRLAAGVLLAGAAAEAVQPVVYLLREELPVQVPLLQVAMYFASEWVAHLIPPALLLAASTRRYHDEPAFAQRLILYAALATGVFLTVMLIDQAWRWLAGTPPFWALPLDPTLARSIPAATLRLWRIQQLVSVPLDFLYGLAALTVALLGLWTRARRRRLFLVLVLAWLLSWSFSLVMAVVLQVVDGNVTPSRLAWACLPQAMALLLPVLAWCSVREEPTGEIT